MSVPNKSTATTTRSIPTLTGLLVVALAGLFHFLRPSMLDGDGLQRASDAIFHPPFGSMDLKHLLVPAALKGSVVLAGLVHQENRVLDFLLVENSLATLATFVLLARFVFPRVIKDPFIALICALGTVLTYGVLSRSASLEVYALALLSDVLLIGSCLRPGLGGRFGGVLLGVLSVLAVSVHVTNVAMAPAVLVLVFTRLSFKDAVRTSSAAALTAVVLLSVLLGLYQIDRSGHLVPVDLRALLPSGDHQPPMGGAARLGRVGYGFARTFAYLPFKRDLSATFLAVYASALLAFLMVTVAIARKGLARSPGATYPVLGVSLALMLPFGLIGAYYYPSDPERWLFLMPIVWVWIGLIWDADRVDLGPRPSRWLLLVVVLSLGTYNSLAIRREDRTALRELTGLRALYQRTRATDLVISPSGVTSPIYRFYLDSEPRFCNLTLVRLVETHKADRASLEADLRAEIDAALRADTRVLVYDLIGENHVKSEGYPWAHFDFDYGPETFVKILDRYRVVAVDPPSSRRPGLYRLLAKPDEG